MNTINLTLDQECDVVVEALKFDYENGVLGRKDYKAVRRVLKYYMGEQAFNEYLVDLATDDAAARVEAAEDGPYYGCADFDELLKDDSISLRHEPLPASRKFKVGDTVRILVDQYDFKAGDVTTISRDDGSNGDCPYWVAGSKWYPAGACLMTNKLELIADPQKLLVGDTVEVLVAEYGHKVGDRLVITMDDGSDGDCPYWTGHYDDIPGRLCWDTSDLKLIHRPVQ